MNLAISPVNVASRHSTQNSYKNNNQNQSFGALRVEISPKTKLPRETDISIDKFLHYFEDIAKRIGLDTEKLERKGYSVLFDSTKTDDIDCGIINGVLKNKNGKSVKEHGRNVKCTVTSDMESYSAEKFAKTVHELEISA